MAPDGGVVVLFSSPLFEAGREAWSTRYAERGPQVGVAISLSPDGEVRSRRGFLGDDPSIGALLDAAEDIVNAVAARTRAEVDAQRRRTQGRPDGWRRWFRRRS